MGAGIHMTSIRTVLLLEVTLVLKLTRRGSVQFGSVQCEVDGICKIFCNNDGTKTKYCCPDKNFPHFTVFGGFQCCKREYELLKNNNKCKRADSNKEKGSKSKEIKDPNTNTKDAKDSEAKNSNADETNYGLMPQSLWCVTIATLMLVFMF